MARGTGPRRCGRQFGTRTCSRRSKATWRRRHGQSRSSPARLRGSTCSAPHRHRITAATGAPPPSNKQASKQQRARAGPDCCDGGGAHIAMACVAFKSPSEAACIRSGSACACSPTSRNSKASPNALPAKPCSRACNSRTHATNDQATAEPGARRVCSGCREPNGMMGRWRSVSRRSRGLSRRDKEGASLRDVRRHVGVSLLGQAAADAESDAVRHAQLRVGVAPLRRSCEERMCSLRLPTRCANEHAARHSQRADRGLAFARARFCNGLRASPLPAPRYSVSAAFLVQARREEAAREREHTVVERSQLLERRHVARLGRLQPRRLISRPGWPTLNTGWRRHGGGGGTHLLEKTDGCVGVARRGRRAALARA